MRQHLYRTTHTREKEEISDGYKEMGGGQTEGDTIELRPRKTSSPNIQVAESVSGATRNDATKEVCGRITAFRQFHW